MSKFREMRDEWERATLSAALEECGSATKAAKALGLNRTHFLRKCVQLGVREKRPRNWVPRVGNWAIFGL